MMNQRKLQQRKATCCALSILLLAGCAEGRVTGLFAPNTGLSGFFRRLNDAFGSSTTIELSAAAQNGPLGQLVEEAPANDIPPIQLSTAAQNGPLGKLVEEAPAGSTNAIPPIQLSTAAKNGPLGQLVEAEAQEASAGNTNAIPPIQLSTAAQNGPLGQLVEAVPPIQLSTAAQNGPLGQLVEATATHKGHLRRLEAADSGNSFGNQEVVPTGNGFGSAVAASPNSGPADTRMSGQGPSNTNGRIGDQQQVGSGGSFGNTNTIPPIQLSTAAQNGPLGQLEAEAQEAPATYSGNTFGNQDVVPAGNGFGSDAAASPNGEPAETRMSGKGPSNTNGRFGGQQQVGSGGSFGSTNTIPPIQLSTAAQNGPLGQLEAKAQEAPAADSGNGFGNQDVVPAGNGFGSTTTAASTPNGGPADTRMSGQGLSYTNGRFGNQQQADSGSSFGSTNAVPPMNGIPPIQLSTAAQNGPLGQLEAQAQEAPVAPIQLSTAAQNGPLGELEAPGQESPAAQSALSRASSGFEVEGTVAPPGLERRGNVRTQSCEMKIKFFPDYEKEPSALDVQGLMFITNKYFHDLYGADTAATKDSFKAFKATEIDHSYKPSLGEDTDIFQVEFKSNIELVPGSKVSMNSLHQIIDKADFQHFIKAYIWHSPPEKENQFYNTKFCNLKCWDEK